jgi:uncharacterized SAM-binding protein YcdF (DUF218 family)
MRLTTFVLVVIASFTMIWYAPKYLTYADKPVKSDVIVVFVGHDFNARKKEAFKLIEEGYAQTLLIPGCGTNINVLTNSRMSASTSSPIHASTHPLVNASPHYSRYFENTHKEMLEAKKAIDKAGFRSAIFVSSPFHMRRIKIMADNIFDSKFLQIKFVPTRYESGTDPVWILSMRNVEMVVMEYVKVVWFMVYRHFTAQVRLE